MVPKPAGGGGGGGGGGVGVEVGTAVTALLALLQPRALCACTVKE